RPSAPPAWRRNMPTTWPNDKPCRLAVMSTYSNASQAMLHSAEAKVHTVWPRPGMSQSTSSAKCPETNSVMRSVVFSSERVVSPTTCTRPPDEVDTPSVFSVAADKRSASGVRSNTGSVCEPTMKPAVNSTVTDGYQSSSHHQSLGRGQKRPSSQG